MFLCSLALAMAFSQGMVGQAPRPTKAEPKMANPPAPATGTLSGRVFAITKGGDIAPARMANVFVIPTETAEGVDVTQKLNSAIFAARTEALSRIREVEDKYDDQTLACNMDLDEGYKKGIRQTLHWFDNSDQAFARTTDEDGQFLFANVLPPNRYFVIVMGEAGYNNAVWMGTIVLKSGGSLKVKMSSPIKSCLKLPD
jgi:hypothetical protein